MRRHHFFAVARRHLCQSTRIGTRGAVLFLCFFLSGTAGLLYQVLWLRTLTLLLGHTVYAITTVLTAFMAGLALGSALFARLSPRLRNVIAAYGWMEIAIGLICAAMPALLWTAAAVYVRLHAALGLSAGQFGLLQFAVIFALLVVPTTLMGGTLPVLAQGLVGEQRRVGGIGLLYAVNTFGAVVGTVLAGYTLLPALGTLRTTMLAVAANLVAGVLGLLLSRGWRATPTPAVTAPAGERWDRKQQITVLVFGLSGAVAMLYEVGWTRALTQILGSSTYAFTAMLVAFLVGIALGSALYVWLRGRRDATVATFATIQVAIGVTVAVTLALFERLPELFLWGFVRFQGGWVELLQLGVASAALLPSTLLVGATFPCAVAVVVRARHLGRDVGHVYAINTVGAIIGVALAGFLLVPVLGVHTTIKLGALANLIAGGVILLMAARSWRWTAVITVGLLIAATWSIPLWDLRVMAAGTGIYARAYTQGYAQYRADEQVVFYRDGLSGTVSVIDARSARTLRVNGKTDASTGGDMSTQVLTGHIPMLVHPEPRRVMILGLGSGVSVGSAITHGFERMDVVELEPAVVEASRFFAAVNGNPLSRPGVRLVVTDGRTFLLTTPERYDVLVSNPSNPWMAGVATLFTVEFFEIARSRLRPGGVMAQWLQGYNLSAADFTMVLRTFRAVFPSTSLWYVGHGDFLLVGTTQDTRLDLGRLRARLELPDVRKDLARVGVRAWPEILGFVALGPSEVARLTQGAGLSDDDRLPLEFSAPRALYRVGPSEVSPLVFQARALGFVELVEGGAAAVDRPEIQSAVASTFFRLSRFRDALDRYNDVLRHDPNNRAVLLAAAASALKLQLVEVARDYAGRVVAGAPDDAEAHYYLGLSLSRLGRPEAAVAALTRAAALAPNDGRVREALAALRR